MRIIGIRVVWIAAALFTTLAGCTTLDRGVSRTPSNVLDEVEASATTLGRAWSDAAPADIGPAEPVLSAFRLLPNNLEAFAARVAMIDAAERTLDLQYFIFRTDDTSLFLVDRMVAAADRGVRVRILIDDMCAHGIEKSLVAFDAHPNIELRLFNPWTQRAGALVRGVEFVFTPRLNHRMHNKLFIADGVVAVLGGRNLGDEYFTLNDKYDFRDLDVAAAGPVVHRANELFDEFWNGDDSIPVSGLRPLPDVNSLLADARARLAAHRERLAASPYAQAVRSTEFVQELRSGSVQWVFAPGRIVGDWPDKTVRADDAEWTGSLARQASDVFFSAESELLIASPYFVPGKKFTRELCDLDAAGAQVVIITNSQTSSDVPFVHGAYARYRPQLLQGGVELFELRLHGAAIDPDEKPEFGSVNSSLHAKAFVVDRRFAYIGSLNLDPRSVVLNTEIGVLIDSPPLAEIVAANIQSLMQPAWSYRVTRTPEGKIVWVCDDAEGGEMRFTHDPETSFWDRLSSDIGALLPIEDQL